MRQKLNNSLVDDLEQRDKQFIEWDAAQPGFGVRLQPQSKVGKGPKKTFLFMGRMKGKSRSPPKTFTIGYFPNMNVATARRIAREYATQLANGINPTAKVRAQTEIPMFGEAATAFIDFRQRGERTNTEYQFYVDGHLKRFKKLRLDEITHDDVRALHNSMRDIPTMANRVVKFLGAVYRPQMVAHDIRNPFIDWKRGGGKLYPEKRRKVDSPDFAFPRWRAGIEAAIPDSKQKTRDVLLFAIFSGLRRSEVCGIRWSDISSDAGTFSVTAKGDKPLTVYLTRQLREILASRREDTMDGCDWIFPSDTGNKRTGKLPSGPVVSFHGGGRNLFAEISEAGGAKFWFHATRNTYLRVCRDLGYPAKMRKFLVGHEPGDQTGDVTEDYEGDYSPEHMALAAQVAADRIEAFMFERVAAEELKPAWLAAAQAETAAVMPSNVYLLEASRTNRAR